MDTLTVETLAHVLPEPYNPRFTQVLRTLGQDRCCAILVETRQCEANGGMLTKDGTRRRTPGGIFFQLVKARVPPQERQRLFPRTHAKKTQHPPVPPLDWYARKMLVAALPLGEATVTLTLSGRPDIQTVQTRLSYVAFRMQGQEPNSFPAGLPPVPGQTSIAWLVVVALKQWNKVKESLAAQTDDVLRIDGHPVETKDGAHVLLAQRCVSLWQQREKKQARHER